VNDDQGSEPEDSGTSGAPAGRWIAIAMFVGSAAVAAFALKLAWREPIAGAVGLAIAAGVLLVRWISRRRAQRLFMSGDVSSVLNRWSSALERIPHAETMGPLMTATAFAAYGWVERARAVLQSAERGPAWDAALEHRLFLDALLATFEGDSETALDRADRLARLPMPSAAPALLERIKVLRSAVAALARAFAHDAREGDRKLLIDASAASPLVHWAMRYGAAILAVDADDLAQATTLISGAPEWPSESCFSRFHREILDEVARRQAKTA
jgi:hypothetical protein